MRLSHPPERRSLGKICCKDEMDIAAKAVSHSGSGTLLEPDTHGWPRAQLAQKYSLLPHTPLLWVPCKILFLTSIDALHHFLCRLLFMCRSLSLQIIAITFRFCTNRPYVASSKKDRNDFRQLFFLSEPPRLCSLLCQQKPVSDEILQSTSSEALADFSFNSELNYAILVSPLLFPTATRLRSFDWPETSSIASLVFRLLIAVLPVRK